ncbi:MAG: hypothetical protein ACRBDI_04915 [Alphaproteobacteria bacterium]
MTTLLPQDSNDNPIPALRMKNGAAHQITIGASSIRNGSAFNADTQIISLYADVPIYLAFGDSSITATTSDHFFPAGIYYDVSIGGDKSAHYTHIAVLQVNGAGTLHISEKE